MNFKEALIAHLQGEKVEAMGIEGEWKPLMQKIGDGNFSYIDHNVYIDLKFRLAPRTIFVNGVEVPAGEKVAPPLDTEYFLPETMEKNLYARTKWIDHETEKLWLARGIVYLNKDDAIARAKAMLLTSDK